jgi:hypothetical protein
MNFLFNETKKHHKISKEHSPELRKQPRVKNEKQNLGFLEFEV